MKKNGYLRKFIAMFLVFVMLMADSSMTTFADVVGRSVQQNAVEDEENGIDLQSANDVNVTVTAPDGTYYVKLKQKENEWWASDIASASVQVQNGKGTCSLDGSNLNDSKENWLEIGLQENGSFVKSGEVLRSEGKIYSVTESNHAFTVNEISIQPGTQRNFKDILGSATNFGIVANEATFKGHLESNFAIGKLNYEGSNVQMSKNEGGGAGYNYIGEFVGSSQLQIGLNGNAGGSVVYAGKGAEGKLTTDNSDLLIDYDTYTEAQIKKIVKDMVDTIKTTSTTLYNENSVPYSAVTDISTSGNQYTDINIAKYGKDAGTYYVSFQPGEFNTFMSNPNRSITIREDQNIVLNVPDTNVDFRQFTFVIVDASGNVVYQKTTNANSDEDRVAENVIFNCPNATTAATYTSTGIFLVPNATFTNAIVSAGWVIANTIAAIGGQEWHNVYKGMPVVETTFQIKATKNVDNAPATDEKYDGKFSFELQEKDGENWKTIDSVTNTGSAIVFDNLGKFGTEGTHYYKIVETASALSDVTIDGEPVYVKAVIKKNGNKMVATVTYYSDENYATEVSDPSFNNTTVITEKTEVSVEKKWADNENQDRVRPGSIQVQLYADETAQGDPIELNEDNGWKYTWSNLEKKSGSNDIEYTVDEVSVPAGYTKTVTANEAKTSYVITNTHTTETTEATVRKVWNDSNDQDGKRPTSIIVNLLADGNATGTTVTLNEDNGWAATVNNLPKKANGTDIVYSWSEGNMPEGYSLTDTAKDGTVTTLTNSYSTEETSVSVRKVWTDSDNQDGIRPESISVQLKADGKASGEPVVLNEANNWTYTWTKLAKNANKTEIQYTVDEVDVPSGYTKTVTKESTGYVITNTHNPETTSINGTKTWSDNDNQDGKRPTSITVNLLANGTKVDSKEVTADNNWKYSFKDLPKYADGKEIVYTVTEDKVDGYETTVNGYNILNTHTPETTFVNGTKHWDDNDDQDGKRPESITVNLLANGEKVNSQVVTAAGNWTYNFTDLPKYAEGSEIEYTVEEVAVKGYTTELDGYDIYNTHTPETTIVEGTKSWNDKDNQDGKRPEKIIVNLLANGEKVDTQVVTADNDWKYSFKDLPVYKDGQKLTYTVSEETVKDYTTEYDGTNIINSYTPGKTSASVVKVWNDAGNQDGIRPAKITVKLLADGQDTGKTVTLSVDNNWTQSITGLDEKKGGKAIKYTWAEENVPEGYELTGNTADGTVTTLTNKHVPEVTAITGTKTWNDNDNQDGKRPTSITVNLLADGTVYASQTVTAATNWKYTFDNLPVNKNGTAINYTIGEVEVTDYTTEIDEYDIINTHTPETTSVSGQKVWDDANNQDGKRPNSIKVRLLANGTEVATKDVTAADNWAYNFTDLPKYANGEEIVYTVTEDAVPDYTTAINGTTITNSYTPGKTSITVTKAWVDNDNQDGIRPDSIKVQLYAGEDAQGEEVTLDGTNNWTYTWTGLDAKKDGQDIVYTVKETGEVTGYTSEISGDAQTGFVITNTHKTEITSVEGKKVWDDADNQDGKRPESIKVRLLANGTEVATKDVTAADNWTYSFTDLPKFADGKEIVYTVTEDAVADYTTAIDGTTITNSYKPGKTSITVTKAWADNDNQDGIRPENIKVQLYAGETAQGEEVTLSADNNWTYTWSELDAKKDGQDIVYTVRETEVPAGYEAIVTGTAAEGFILTNTHETEVISVEGIKTWNDNDQTTKRPESITVRLLADGKEAGSQKVTADSNWTYKFTELPKYAAGKEIVYTVSEDAVPGYITSVNGNNLINTITSVKVSKVDITDHKELAGAHIQILDKDGNIIDEWDSTWEAHEVTGLKTNEQYTLRETVAPDGYTVTSDTTFTLKEDGTVDKDNTQTTVSDDGTLLVEDSKTSVKVSKVDIADGKELEGAHIQVIDEDENIVAEWDSTKEPRVIKGLKTDKKYILRETVAPTGYELTNDTTFVLKADGTVDTEKTTTVSKDGVLLVQDKLATGQSIAVTKKLTTITGDLRAMDQTFYVALYSDEACTQRVSDVKAIEFKNASSSTVVFNENIEVNKDYYIAECSQDGTAQSMGALADGTMYEAKFNNGNKATVKEANGTTTVYFDNVFSSIPDGYYKQGKLTITKKLLGADGNAKKSDNVFYAGIFDDADYTQLSTQVSQNIVKLDLAGGSEVSQVIKIGLDVNKTVTLYVTETDSNGKPVAGTSGFAYKVSVDGSTVTIDEANENASVTITNTENPTTTKTTTEESGNESGSSASSHSMSSSTKAPKTGDDTPIAMYVIILIAAAALIVFGFEKRRRSNRK